MNHPSLTRVYRVPLASEFEEHRYHLTTWRQGQFDPGVSPQGSAAVIPLPHPSTLTVLFVISPDRLCLSLCLFRCSSSHVVLLSSFNPGFPSESLRPCQGASYHFGREALGSRQRQETVSSFSASRPFCGFCPCRGPQPCPF